MLHHGDSRLTVPGLAVLHAGPAGVQYVAEHHRLAAVQLEMGVHELAQGVLLPVVGKTQLGHRLVPVGSQHRHIGLRRVAGGVGRRRTHHEGDAHVSEDRRTHGCRFFIDMNSQIESHRNSSFFDLQNKTTPPVMAMPFRFVVLLCGAFNRRFKCLFNTPPGF